MDQHIARPHPDAPAIASLLVGPGQHQGQIGAGMQVARNHLPGRPLLETKRDGCKPVHDVTLRRNPLTRHYLSVSWHFCMMLFIFDAAGSEEGLSLKARTSRMLSSSVLRSPAQAQ